MTRRMALQSVEREASFGEDIEGHIGIGDRVHAKAANEGSHTGVRLSPQVRCREGAREHQKSPRTGRSHPSIAPPPAWYPQGTVAVAEPRC